MANLDELLDNYLSGATGPLLDPSVGATGVGPGPATLHGIAEGSAAGAVVVGEDGLVTLVLGLTAWPAGVRGALVEASGEPGAARGRRVEVSGQLVRRMLEQAPTPGPDGAQRHGMVGDSGPSVGPRWRRIGD